MSRDNVACPRCDNTEPTRLSRERQDPSLSVAYACDSCGTNFSVTDPPAGFVRKPQDKAATLSVEALDTLRAMCKRAEETERLYGRPTREELTKAIRWEIKARYAQGRSTTIDELAAAIGQPYIVLSRIIIEGDGVYLIDEQGNVLLPPIVTESPFSEPTSEDDPADEVAELASDAADTAARVTVADVRAEDINVGIAEAPREPASPSVGYDIKPGDAVYADAAGRPVKLDAAPAGPNPNYDPLHDKIASALHEALRDIARVEHRRLAIMAANGAAREVVDGLKASLRSERQARKRDAEAAQKLLDAERAESQRLRDSLSSLSVGETAVSHDDRAFFRDAAAAGFNQVEAIRRHARNFKAATGKSVLQPNELMTLEHAEKLLGVINTEFVETRIGAKPVAAT